MPISLHFGKDTGNPALAINYKRGAFDAHYLFAVHVLLFENSEGIDDFLLRIGQESVGQLVLLFEFFLRLGCIGRDAEYSCASFFNLFERVAEPARLNGSPWSVGFGKEEEHHGFSFKIFKRDLLALFIEQSKIRSFVVDFHAVPFRTTS